MEYRDTEKLKSDLGVGVRQSRNKGIESNRIGLVKKKIIETKISDGKIGVFTIEKNLWNQARNKITSQ